MHKDVTAASRHEYIVLYDPAAIPLDTPVDSDLEAQNPTPLSAEAMVSLAERGLAVALRIESEDCQADLRLMLDESVDVHIRDRSVLALDGAILRLPRGKLVVDGIEFLCRDGETRIHSEAEVVEVPPGDYRVLIFNLMPWKNRHRPQEIHRKTTRLDRVVGRFVDAYTLLGVVLLPANILLVPGIVFAVWLISGWQPALALAGTVFLIDVLVLVGFWLLEYASKWLPILNRARFAELAFDAENPDIAVYLQQAPEEATIVARGMADLAIE